MSENSSSSSATPQRLARHAFVFGGIAGAISALCVLAEFALGFHGARILSLWVPTTLGFAVPIVAIMIGIMRWRDRALEGNINFTQSMGVALAIGLVYSAIVAGFTGIYAAFINPNYLSALVGLQVDNMRQLGATADEMAKATETGMRGTSAGIAMARFSFFLTLSLVVGLICALLVRKRSA